MAVLDEAYATNWHMFSSNVFAEALHYIHIAWQRKIVFFENPKAASTTMKHSLMQYEWGVRRPMSFDDLHDRRYSPLLNILQVPAFQALLDDPSFIKVAIVRNPFSRILAAYLDQVKQKSPDRMSNIIPFLGRHRHDVWTDISFPEFVDAICRQPVSLMDPHWRVQSDQLYVSHVKYDKIGKLESLPDFFAYLESARPGISDYIQSNVYHKVNAADKLKEFYTPKIIIKIKEKFAADFEKFSYSTL